MPLTTMLATLGIFLIGVSIGWRFRVRNLVAILPLILAFAAFDYVIEEITLWSVTYWVIVDLIAVQIGYVVGATLGFVVAQRKAHNRSESG